MGVGAAMGLGMIFGGVGGLGAGLTLYHGLTRGLRRQTDEPAERMYKLLASKELRDLMSSDLSDRAIRDFTMSEKVKNFFKQADVSDKTLGLERTIRQAIRPVEQPQEQK